MQKWHNARATEVLILIVLEHTLGAIKFKKEDSSEVLILIVLEHILGVGMKNYILYSYRLNPYCIGTYSRS